MPYIRTNRTGSARWRALALRLLTVSCVTLLLGSSLSALEDAPGEPDPAGGARFRAGQLLVKLAPGLAIGSQEAGDALEDLARQPGSASLHGALSRAGAVGMTRAFAGLVDGAGRPRAAQHRRAARVDERIARRALPAPSIADAELLDIYLVELAADTDVLRAVTELAQHPDVVYVEPNYVLHVDLEPLPDVPLVPSDPFVSRDGSHWSEASWGQAYPDLWGVRRTRTVEGWNVFDEDGSGVFEHAERRPGEGIVVAVIDSGLDRHHPEIAQNVWRNPGEIPDNGVDDDDNGLVDDVWGWDFANGDADPSDGHGHGTHVAGTIAASTDDGFGVVGVAPWATLMPIKGLSDTGEGTITGLASAVRYAADMGADVISNSWGGLGSSATLEAAFDYAAALGAIAVASAGNSNVDASSAQPAGFESVLAVAALGPDDTRASFSNFGRAVDISAPGVDVLSLNANGGANLIAQARPELVVSPEHLRLSGTSMACPHVSGALALLLSRYPDDSPAEIRGRLRAGAESVDAANPDFAGRLGSGRLDTERALVISPRPLVDLIGVEIGRLAPGEEALLSVRLVNRWLGVGPVTAVLRAGSPFVSVLEGVVALGDISTGEAVGNEDEPFRVVLHAATPVGEDLTFALELHGPDGLLATLGFVARVALFHNLGDHSGLPLRDFFAWRASFRDLDGDGRQDAQWVAFDGPSLFRNDGDGRFENATFQSGLFPTPFGTSQLLPIDVDNDGDLDLFVASSSQNQGSRLFENRGGGSLVDRTDDSVRGVRAFVAAAFDFDGDGFVDIVGGALPDLREGIAHPGGLFLLRNEGGESFTNAIEGTCLPASQWLLNGQIATFDYDDDGDLDLLTVGFFWKTRLYRNEGDGTFLDVTQPAGLTPYGHSEEACRLHGAYSNGRRCEPGVAFGLATGDYDDDGDLDVFLTGWGPLSENALFRNEGNGTFENVTDAAGDLAGEGPIGLHWGNEFFDFDNDGDLDLYVTNTRRETVLSNVLYRNDGDGTFSMINEIAFPLDVAPSAGVAAIGDLDGDGGLDIWAPSSTLGNGLDGGLLENLFARHQHWIRIQLVGVASHRDAYGARVTLTADGRSQVRELHTGGVETQLHFGLGEATRVDSIEVRWPSGLVQVVEPPETAMDGPFTITEPAVCLETPDAPECAAVQLPARPDPVRQPGRQDTCKPTGRPIELEGPGAVRNGPKTIRFPPY